MHKYKCPNCQGTGKQVWEEDFKKQFDVCYHCSNTGVIDHETMENDLLNQLVNVIAVKMSELSKKEVNENGEGFEFFAAESGLSDREYFIHDVWKNEKSVIKELTFLSPQFINALKSLLTTKIQPIKKEFKEEFKEESVSEDIPF